MSGSAVFNASEIAQYYAARIPQLRQRGKQWRGCCLLHRGKNLSFSVHPETGCWYCFSDCGRGGSLIDFEMELTGADFRMALEAIYAIVGRPAPASALHNSRDVQERRHAVEVEQRDAAYFAIAAKVVIEAELERLPTDAADRRFWTQILVEIQEDSSAVFRRLKKADRRTAAAFVYAGCLRGKRLQATLARFVMRIASQEVHHAA